MTNKVKSYNDDQLLDRMRGLESFKSIPNGFHIIAIRSEEDKLREDLRVRATYLSGQVTETNLRRILRIFGRDTCS